MTSSDNQIPNNIHFHIERNYINKVKTFFLYHVKRRTAFKIWSLYKFGKKFVLPSTLIWSTDDQDIKELHHNSYMVRIFFLIVYLTYSNFIRVHLKHHPDNSIIADNLKTFVCKFYQLFIRLKLWLFS